MTETVPANNKKQIVCGIFCDDNKFSRFVFVASGSKKNIHFNVAPDPNEHVLAKYDHTWFPFHILQFCDMQGEASKAEDFWIKEMEKEIDPMAPNICCKLAGTDPLPNPEIPTSLTKTPLPYTTTFAKYKNLKAKSKTNENVAQKNAQKKKRKLKADPKPCSIQFEATVKTIRSTYFDEKEQNDKRKGEDFRVVGQSQSTVQRQLYNSPPRDFNEAMFNTENPENVYEFGADKDYLTSSPCLKSRKIAVPGTSLPSSSTNTSDGNVLQSILDALNNQTLVLESMCKRLEVVENKQLDMEPPQLQPAHEGHTHRTPLTQLVPQAQSTPIGDVQIPLSLDDSDDGISINNLQPIPQQINFRQEVASITNDRLEDIGSVLNDVKWQSQTFANRKKKISEMTKQLCERHFFGKKVMIACNVSSDTYVRPSLFAKYKDRMISLEKTVRENCASDVSDMQWLGFWEEAKLKLQDRIKIMRRQCVMKMEPHTLALQTSAHEL